MLLYKFLQVRDILLVIIHKMQDDQKQAKHHKLEKELVDDKTQKKQNDPND